MSSAIDNRIFSAEKSKLACNHTGTYAHLKRINVVHARTMGTMQENKMTILFFVYFLVRTTTKSVKFINKPVSCFGYFHVFVLFLLAK
jgi:hypothetical protein